VGAQEGTLCLQGPFLRTKTAHTAAAAAAARKGVRTPWGWEEKKGQGCSVDRERGPAHAVGRHMVGRQHTALQRILCADGRGHSHTCQRRHQRSGEVAPKAGVALGPEAKGTCCNQTRPSTPRSIRRPKAGKQQRLKRTRCYALPWGHRCQQALAGGGPSCAPLHCKAALPADTCTSMAAAPGSVRAPWLYRVQPLRPGVQQW
jgi:hypothetical protein